MDMKTRWFHVLASTTLVGALTCLGCGQAETSVDPSQTQTPEQYQKEMSEQQDVLMGEKPATAPAPEAKPEGEGEGEAKE
jgi:hypothetical protein